MREKGVWVVTVLALMAAFMIPIGTSEEVSGNNSIYSFNISNCQSNTSIVGCDAASIRFQCNIEPPGIIDSVDFYIEGSYYTTTQSGSLFYYDFAKTQDTSSTTDPISLTKEKIFDVGAGFVLAFEEVHVNRTCDVCSATFQVNCTACNISDQQFCQYTSSNESCNPSYNATETCDYCVPDWQPRTGSIYDCQESNTKFVFYDDFAACYAQTGLWSDGPPVDHNSTQSCSFFSGDFNCTVDPEPFLTKKMNVLCQMPTGADRYDCTTYVKKDVNSSILLQTNPEYKIPVAALISFGGESEPRTSFTNDGQNLNAYFTKKNLEVETTFILGVRCSTNHTLLEWEGEIKPIYRNWNAVTGRTIWAGDNAGYITVFIFAVLIVAVLIGFAIKKGKGG